MNLLGLVDRSIAKIKRNHRSLSDTLRVRRSLKHVAGPKYIYLPEGQIVVVLLGRNMAHYLCHFHDYYSDLGVKYFIYADNGSTDDTIEIVSRWSNTTVLSTDLNFRDFQIPIRHEISTRYCSDGWRLAVDPDELFDYVGSQKFSIIELAKSIKDRGFNGLVSQMLDMVADSELLNNTDSFAKSVEKSIYYSLKDITSFDYRDRNVPFSGLADSNIVPQGGLSWKYGGLRKQYFEENCCLTKHPLFFYEQGVEPFQHPHLTTGLKLADFTALLKHYKFSGDFVARERELLLGDRISHIETAQRAEVIGTRQSFRFDVSSMDTDSSPLNLVNRKFLSMSEQAMKVYT